MGFVEVCGLLVFVAAAQAILHNCTEYCNSQSSHLSNINWQNCNCTETKAASNETDEGDLHLDDTGIYYEPAETISTDTISFSGVPFFILNPALKTLHSIQNDTGSSKPSSHSAAMRAAEEDSDEESTFSYSPEVKPIHKQRKNDSNIHRIDIEADEFPIYLDIDIHAPVKNSGRSTLQDPRKMDNIQRIEQELRDCLDLHVVQFARTHRNTEILHVDLKKYENITDMELTNEINRRCVQPTNIIDQSLKEIQNRWPTVNKGERRYAEEQDSSRNGNPINPNDNVDNMTILDQMESSPTINIPIFEITRTSLADDDIISTFGDLDMEEIHKFDNVNAESNIVEQYLIPTTAVLTTSTNEAHEDRSTYTEPSSSESNVFERQAIPTTVVFTTTTNEVPKDLSTNTEPSNFGLKIGSSTPPTITDTINDDYLISKNEQYNTSTVVPQTKENDMDFTTKSSNILFKDMSTIAEPSNIVLNSELSTEFPTSPDIVNSGNFILKNEEYKTSTIMSRSMEEDIDFTTEPNSILFANDNNFEKDLETSNSDFINNFLNVDTSIEEFLLERNNDQNITTKVITANHENENMTDTVSTEQLTISPILSTVKPILELKLNKNISAENIDEHANNKTTKEKQTTPIAASTEIITRQLVLDHSPVLHNHSGLNKEIEALHADKDNFIEIFSDRPSVTATNQEVMTTGVPETIMKQNETEMFNEINSTVIMTVETTPRQYVTTNPVANEDLNLTNNDTVTGKIIADESNIITVTIPTPTITQSPDINQNNSVIYRRKLVSIEEGNNTTTAEVTKSSHDDTTTETITRQTTSSIYEEQEPTSLTTPRTRIQLQESEILLPKISTVEFPNETIKSIEDGNETLPNDDFKEFDDNSLITGPDMKDNIEERPNTLLTTETSTITSPVTAKTKTQDVEEPDIAGKLFFLYDQQQIPARFVQKPNGNIYVGIDGSSLCDRLLEDRENRSVFLSALCSYIKSKNRIAT